VRGDENGEAHGQADCAAIVLVKALNAAETNVFADEFQHGIPSLALGCA
jgi:hypothetical protein